MIHALNRKTGRLEWLDEDGREHTLSTKDVLTSTTDGDCIYVLTAEPDVIHVYDSKGTKVGELTDTCTSKIISLECCDGIGTLISVAKRKMLSASTCEWHIERLQFKNGAFVRAQI